MIQIGKISHGHLVATAEGIRTAQSLIAARREAQTVRAIDTAKTDYERTLESVIILAARDLEKAGYLKPLV